MDRGMQEVGGSVEAKWGEKNLENTLNRFIEAIAVMLVTSCVIPILVLLFFVWLVKLVLGVNITLPQIGKKKKEGKRI